MALPATAIRTRADVFPPGRKTRQKRASGADKKVTQIGFRPPPDLVDYIEKNEAAGYTKTAVILRAVTIARDTAEQLGDEWWEIEKRANMEGVGPGVILGRLALEALSSKRR